MNTVPSSFKTAIKPPDIFVAKDGHAFMAMMGTLDKSEYEGVAAHFVASSQGNGKWTGFIYEDRAGQDTDFAAMMKLGFLSETKVDEGWLYELTQFAIEQIYVRQTNSAFNNYERSINQMKAEVRRAHGTTFLRRLCKLLTPAPLPT